MSVPYFCLVHTSVLYKNEKDFTSWTDAIERMTRVVRPMGYAIGSARWCNDISDYEGCERVFIRCDDCEQTSGMSFTLIKRHGYLHR
jgi:hypothetical protein